MAIDKKYSANRGKSSFLRRNLKLLSVIGIVALLVIGSALYITLNNRNDSQDNAQQTTSNSSKVNLDPPTEQELTETDQHKDDLANQNPTPPTPIPGTKKSVQPIISYADKTTVNAYVPGIFEDGGVCTATFTQGSQTVSKTSEGFQNASYTQCAPFNSNLGSGEWSVTVKYSSTNAEGSSTASNIK